MATELTSVPTLAPGVEAHVIGGDVLVLDGVRLSRLTGVTAAVARLVDGTRSVARIARATSFPEPQVVEELAGLVAAGVVDPGAPSPSDGYRRPDHIGVCRDHEQVILLDLRDGERHVLSPTATAIWDALLETGSLAAAVAGLEEVFEGASGLADDTAAFVATLEAQGLVERSEGVPS